MTAGRARSSRAGPRRHRPLTPRTVSGGRRAGFTTAPRPFLPTALQAGGRAASATRAPSRMAARTSILSDPHAGYQPPWVCHATHRCGHRSGPMPILVYRVDPAPDRCGTGRHVVDRAGTLADQGDTAGTASRSAPGGSAWPEARPAHGVARSTFVARTRIAPPSFRRHRIRHPVSGIFQPQSIRFPAPT